MQTTKRNLSINPRSRAATEAKIFATQRETKSPVIALEGFDSESLCSGLPKDILEEFKIGEFIGHEMATLLSEDIDSKEMTIRRIGKNYLPKGLVAYTILSHALSRATIAFRGTKCKDSLRRDFEKHVPGNTTFWQVNTLNCLADACKNALLAAASKQSSETKESDYQSGHSIDIDGHSLGAADAQNFLVYLLQLINKGEQPFVHIKAITFHGMNAPGISEEKYQESLKLLRVINQRLVNNGKNPLKIRCFWIHAAKDPVQRSGFKNIFAEADPELVEHHMLYIKHKMKGNGLIKAKVAHTRRLFRPDAEIERWSYMNNKDPAMRELIYQRLINKSPFLQSWFARGTKAAIHTMTRIVASRGNLLLFIPTSPTDDEESAAKKRVEALIRNSFYWETKSHYSLKFKVPAGIASMQCSDNKWKTNAAAFVTYQAIAVTRKQPCLTRFFACLFSPYLNYSNAGRDLVTDRFYSAFIQASSFKELIAQQGFIDAENEANGYEYRARIA